MFYPNPAARSNRPVPQRGFSMIEVLVTLLIISLALLGTAGLQAYAMRQNQGAQFRTQAVFLVDDLAERMEANKVGAIAGLYEQATKTAPEPLITTCIVAACLAPELATFDLVQWENAVFAALPQATWTVTRTVVGTVNTPTVYTIRVGWVDRLVDTTNVEGAETGVNAAGTGERFFYTATRTIFN